VKVESQEMTELHIKLENIKKDEKIEIYDDVYLRFRIQSDNIKKILFCPIEKKNWFLESGFIENQIVDIKINKERNLPHDVCKEKRLDNYKLAEFNKIHMLIMTDSRDEIISLGSNICDCRKLEEQEWDQYLNYKYDVSNIFAYHWKEKRTEENIILDFSRLVKIASASTNIKIIIVYMFIVVILGAMGSGLIEAIKLLLG